LIDLRWILIELKLIISSEKLKFSIFELRWILIELKLIILYKKRLKLDLDWECCISHREMTGLSISSFRIKWCESWWKLIHLMNELSNEIITDWFQRCCDIRWPFPRCFFFFCFSVRLSECLFLIVVEYLSFICLSFFFSHLVSLVARNTLDAARW